MSATRPLNGGARCTQGKRMMFSRKFEQSDPTLHPLNGAVAHPSVCFAAFVPLQSFILKCSFTSSTTHHYRAHPQRWMPFSRQSSSAGSSLLLLTISSATAGSTFRCGSIFSRTRRLRYSLLCCGEEALKTGLGV
uniref:Uncharacterized protein n=1 Tax=Anopheles coluzzii TaxID=1518534 RepID=A0A8W7P223_ANOCL